VTEEAYLGNFNNRVENLYLTTAAELSQRNIKAGKNLIKICNPEIKEKVTDSKWKPVSQYSPDGEFIRSFPSINEATRQTGINEKSIINVAKGKAHHAGGFIWRYNEK